MAERNEPLLRRRLRSAERFNERAMARGLANENTPLSRSRASLVSVTRCDQRRAFTTDFRFLRFNAFISIRLYGGIDAKTIYILHTAKLIDDFRYRASGKAHPIFCLGLTSDPPRGIDNTVFSLSNSSLH